MLGLIKELQGHSGKLYMTQAQKLPKTTNCSIIQLLYLISELAWPLCFPAEIFLSGASWTLDPRMEVVNFRWLSNFLACNNFKLTKKCNNFRC